MHRLSNIDWCRRTRRTRSKCGPALCFKDHFPSYFRCFANPHIWKNMKTSRPASISGSGLADDLISPQLYQNINIHLWTLDFE